MSSGRDERRVFQWAQEHGEVGGVLTSHTQLTQVLRREGIDVTYVDTGSASRAAAALQGVAGRRGLHLFHITRLWRAVVMAPVFATLRGRTVLVLHSGSTRTQVEALTPARRRALTAALRAYDEIWAVSAEIRDVLPQELVARVTVVTPFDPTASAVPGPGERRPHAIALATNAGLPHYNADLGIEAVRKVRGAWPDATLTILAYGSDGPHLGGLRQQVATEPWLSLRFDASPEEVNRVLTSVGTFLRPTSWDGDSVIVREALAAGARVVASDVSPRPAGVVLAPLDLEGLATAVVEGGPISDGSGLAATTMAEAALAALDRLARS